ncbi:hypothetical protein SASPL_105601 [Salvia splendens]|uniref:Uncharacterized protein n=1 Tax=Salvia splendens TaxID=180675 RepID=A0A8X9A8U1_SALSN|nr:hypothetical protein SASPL_105601 [Salvia splendens]
MAVADGRRDDDEDGAALFEEEGVDYAEDIDLSDIPVHLRPLASSAESGNLDALRQALELENIRFHLDFPKKMPEFRERGMYVVCIIWRMRFNMLMVLPFGF